MTRYANHPELTELANKLFMYTDQQQWDRLQDEVFLEDVHYDMHSAGGPAPATIKASAICEQWKQAFAGLDAIHHQAGHYLIEPGNEKAEIYAHALAHHFKQSALKGKTRTYAGSYEMRAIPTYEGWRISEFKYNLKFIDGNVSLE